ncbi:MCD-domain-containing protein [Coemansia reversa NRRL 1564]|uniref:MCD-domain-containing protein n=1 Tax=Coemansia reversa (strain ATCC 12441 / NRRL 1564) TaxID=763665 RepID=A0A2G5BKQ3_COERN|nr:MCD-domain-containing protein [Coemansia reversa NRRL 1564]|eukprot:PIA19552.1 MCD-domain-containing protein [Coemansia reversa NRRL 1564]
MTGTSTGSTAYPAAPFHASTCHHKGHSPVRDGDELSQPLEPADVRAFWDNMRPEKQPENTHSTADVASLNIQELQELLTTIIHKKARKGAVAMELYTQQCCDIYESLNVDGRKAFLQTLAYQFCAPKAAAQTAAREYLDSAATAVDPAKYAHIARSLRDALTPQYTELFDQINRLPGGFAFLVHMRADMLDYIRSNRQDTAARAMSDGLMMKLETWIIGTLDLKRITWNSPACTIEKLGQYESVHAVKSWLDVKRRLGNGRRCFGFFHRSVPMEPLVFVWVALTDSITSNVQTILQDCEPTLSSGEDAAKCAIFYSINSQPGLAGVDLGNFLIKRVVAVLRAELPNISTFCTLSPLPRFRAWLEQWLTPDCLQTPPNDITVPIQAQKDLIACVPGTRTWTAALKYIIYTRGWTSDQVTLSAMEPVVRTLGAHYLVNLKRGKGNSAYDPVANFHLRNGACLHRLNWRGNTSYSGLRQSLGLMCNYNYVLDRIEDNNERYVRDGFIAFSGDDPFIAQAYKHSAKL